MKEVLRKIWQRSIDPVFYRKKCRDFCRRFRQFDDSPQLTDWRDLGEVRRATVVVAHPDDETFCSGLISSLAGEGVEVDVVCLTRGEGGPTGGESRATLGARREEEMRSACAILGVSQVKFLGYIDPTAKGYRVFAPSVSAADLSIELQDYLVDSDLILSHGSSGEYWHPAHLLVFDAIDRILTGRGLRGK